MLKHNSFKISNRFKKALSTVLCYATLLLISSVHATLGRVQMDLRRIADLAYL